MTNGDAQPITHEIIARLGCGGMAEVFLAAARGPCDTTKLVVLKRLRPKHRDERIFREMFLEEARLALRMNHPHVVHALRLDESDDGELTLVLEYLEGQPLDRVMRELARRESRMPIELAVRLMADALAGLQHAHDLTDFDGTPLELVHRDVSPHNVFVTYAGQVKLCDFGIAKVADAATHTQTGVLKGKAAYMSPEQLAGDAVDRRADVFAAGTVLWELLTGRRLMAAGSQMDTLVRVLRAPVPRASEYAPIDAALDEIVARALERDPAARYQDARAMRLALEDWLAQSRKPSNRDLLGHMVGWLFGDARAQSEQIVRQMLAQYARGSTRMRSALPTEETIVPVLHQKKKRKKLQEVCSHESSTGRSKGTLARKLVAGALVIVGLTAAGRVASTERGHWAAPPSNAELTAPASPLAVEAPRVHRASDQGSVLVSGAEKQP